MSAKRILSLGAGVQSTTLLLMSCKGILPKLDCAIFADTQWEPKEVYDHLDWLEDEAANHNIPVVRVSKGNLREHTMNGFVRGRKEDGNLYAVLPLRVLNPDGTNGMIQRQCTSEYKVGPIDRHIKTEILGLSKTARWPTTHSIDLWFGISVDEMRRIRQAKTAWKQHVYPFCNLPDKYIKKPTSRGACVAWLAENYPGRNMPRSVCIGCPFRSNQAWRYLKKNPKEWADAVEVDEKIRFANTMNREVYLHRSLRPLKNADLGDDPNQMGFGFGEECLGYCGS